MAESLEPLLIAGFPQFLSAFDKYCPFTKFGQFEYHVKTIKLRRRLGSAKAAVEDRDFRSSLYETLRAWQIGTRKSQIKPFAEFEQALQAQLGDIVALDGLAIDDDTIDAQARNLLRRLILGLGIVRNETQVVPNSKALHHILPELVVPMDRAYTQRFFRWPNPKFQYQSEECVTDAFGQFRKIAKAVPLKNYVTGGWHTSRTKVIDNAIVGLLRQLDKEGVESLARVVPEFEVKKT